MSDKAKIQSTNQSAGSAPSAARRRLLRAAAVSAPFIATLPTNLAATVANASTSQCLVDGRKESNDAAYPNPAFDAADSADKWVRVAADYVTATKGLSPNVITRQYYAGTNPFDNGEAFYYVGDKWEEDGSDAAKTTGTALDPTNDIGKLTGSNGWSQTTTKKAVLVMFIETDNGGFISGLQYEGIYPNVQRTTNTAAIQTCLCSVDPDYRSKAVCS